jgi:ectoine hydroxylase-related dioxygenase (phytanoyl-CoA dioxygenase family)
MIFFIIILLLLFISLVLRNLHKKINKTKDKKYNLEKDGITVIPKILTDEQADSIRQLVEDGYSLEAKNIILGSDVIKSRIYEILGPEYEFHDYIFIIKKSQFHACHRDYNGDFFNSTQKHPSYTIIIYLEDMDKCLDVIPRSHKHVTNNVLNITDYTESVICGKGDALLFNANLIHSGSLNKSESNPRIQMKVSHINDRDDTLKFFQQYNKILNKESNHPKWSKNLQKHLSCIAPGISQLTQKFDNNKNRESNDNMGNIISKLFYAKLDNI